MDLSPFTFFLLVCILLIGSVWGWVLYNVIFRYSRTSSSASPNTQSSALDTLTARPVSDTNNSTTIALKAGGTFTGETQDVSNYATIMVSLVSDVSGTVFVDFSMDEGNHWDRSLDYDYTGGTSWEKRIPVTAQWYRIRYVNDTIAQSYFRLQTLLGTQAVDPPALTVGLNRTTLRNTIQSCSKSPC